MNIRCSPIARRHQRGISLIEVLVGIAVGMIGILIIFQTVSVWDKHTQTTRSGGDARIAGTLAMFNLERDLKLAGLGFAKAPMQAMGCQVAAKGGAFSFALAPVVISSSPSGDVIDVLYGNSSYYPLGDDFTASTTSTKKLKLRGGFHPGDLIVVTGNAGASAASSSCQLLQVTSIANVDGLTIDHTTSSYTDFYTGGSASSPFNSTSASDPVFSTGTVYNLGPHPQRNRWQIVNGVLQFTDLINGTPAFAVAENVVDMKAEYGVDSNADQQITDSGPNEWTAAAPVDWSRVLAIRVGIVVRSQQYEKAGDTPSASASAASAAAYPTWSGATPFVMKNVDGTTDSYTAADVNPNNWRYYRYKVYERVIPLRNMLWQ